MNIIKYLLVLHFFLVTLTAFRLQFILSLWCTKGREALKAGINEFILPEKHRGTLELMKMVSTIRERKDIEQLVLLLMQKAVKNSTSSQCVVVHQ